MASRDLELTELRKAPEKVFAEIYGKYRNNFLSWSQKYFGCDRETAADCFQDAVVVLYNNVKTGRLKNLDAGLKTYLFSVGRNILLKNYHAHKNEISMKEKYQFIENDEFTDPEELYGRNDSMIDRIAGLITRMKEPCRSILKHYYYENLGMEEIARIMEYKNANTVKSQKLRCMKYLEEYLLKEIELIKNTGNEST